MIHYAIVTYFLIHNTRISDIFELMTKKSEKVISGGELSPWFVPKTSNIGTDSGCRDAPKFIGFVEPITGTFVS